MIDFDDLCSEIFQILRAYGRDIVLYDETGKRVYEPNEARRMYITGDNLLVSVTEDGDNSAVKLYLSPSVNLTQVSGFIDTLRNMATKSNLLFHVKKFNKEITPQDFATTASVNEQENIKVNTLLEGLYGTSKSSYLKLENARMIVRHSARVNENMIGSRGRNIHSIFVENAQGERFLFPVNMLSGARAMTQHVNQGGNFADDVGQQIIRMAGDFRNLARVAQHVQTNQSALPESATGLRANVLAEMKAMKLTFGRMYEPRSYVRECQRVLVGSPLLEGEDAEVKMTELVSILGEGLDESTLQTVARLVKLPEAVEAVVEEDDVADAADASPDASDDEPMDEARSVEVQVEGEEAIDEDEMPAPKNEAIAAFEAWMAEFDPTAVLSKKASPVAEEVTAEEDDAMGDNDGQGFPVEEDDQAEEGEEAMTENELGDSQMGNDQGMGEGMGTGALDETGSPMTPDQERDWSRVRAGIMKLDAYKAKWDKKEMPEVDEARVAAPEEEGMSMNDIKGALMTFKSKLQSMNPFDPAYGATRREIDALERKLGKMKPYGREVEFEAAEPEMEVGDQEIDEFVAPVGGMGGKPENLTPGFYILSAGDAVEDGPFRSAEDAEAHNHTGGTVSHWTGNVWGDMDESLGEGFDADMDRMMQLAGRR